MEIMLTTRVFLEGLDDGYPNPVAVAQRSMDMPTLPEVGSEIAIGGQIYTIEKVPPYDVRSGWHHAMLPPIYLTDPNLLGATLDELVDHGFDLSWSPQWRPLPGL